MDNLIKKQIMRLPGQSLDEKLFDFVYEKILSYFLYISITIIFIAEEWSRIYWKIEPHPVQITIVGIFASTYWTYKICKNLKEARKLKQGRDGEREVGQRLEELRANGCVIFHDILGNGFNVDHIVVSPHGVFTVETKSWSRRDKNETIKFDGDQLTVNGKHPDRDPIIQSIAQSVWLKNLLKQSTGKEFQVKSAIVFPGWYIKPEDRRRVHEKGVWLLNPKALPAFINNETTILSTEDINLISFHLTQYIKTTF
jgi:hypothetical protein